MTFPNAHEGVKKIRTAELLYLIIAIGGFITAIMITIATASKDKGKMTGGTAHSTDDKPVAARAGVFIYRAGKMGAFVLC